MNNSNFAYKNDEQICEAFSTYILHTVFSFSSVDHDLFTNKNIKDGITWGMLLARQYFSIIADQNLTLNYRQQGTLNVYGEELTDVSRVLHDLFETLIFGYCSKTRDSTNKITENEKKQIKMSCITCDLIMRGVLPSMEYLLKNYSSDISFITGEINFDEYLSELRDNECFARSTYKFQDNIQDICQDVWNKL